MGNVPFDSRNLIYKDPFGAVASGTEVAFRVVLKNDINATAVFIEYIPDGKAPVLQEMIKTKATEQTSTYETKFAFETGLYFYKFKILTDYGEKYILRTNGGKGKISDSGDCWQLTVFNKDFKTPEQRRHNCTTNISVAAIIISVIIGITSPYISKCISEKSDKESLEQLSSAIKEQKSISIEKFPEIIPDTLNVKVTEVPNKLPINLNVTVNENQLTKKE